MQCRKFLRVVQGRGRTNNDRASIKKYCLFEQNGV